MIPATQQSLPTRFKESGFTLIELIVVISIMVLMLGTGVISYLQFNDRQALLAATEELTTVLRSAQTRARTGDRPEGCDRLLSYSVRVPAGSSIVTLSAVCENDTYSRSENTLSGGTTASGLIDVEFRSLHGGVINPGVIILESPQDLQYSFEITEGGEITKGDFVQESAPQSTPTPPGGEIS